MTLTRLSSVFCIAAVTFVACEQSSSQPPRQPVASAVSSPDSGEPSSTTSSRSFTGTTAPATQPEAPAQTKTQPNALGIPATPPEASTGPAASSESSAETPRTPDVVYVPTPQPVVDRMLQMAQVKKNDVVYDLGCGDGRIVVTAAKRYGARAYGFDIDPQRVSEAIANVKAAKVEDLVTIEQKDIFTLDLSPASVVTLYLLPKLNVRLIPQLERLKPGSRIVSHDFGTEGIKPLQVVSLRPPGEVENHTIYLWKTPLVRE
jgi:hypothetical protein